MNLPCQPWGRYPKATHIPRYLYWQDQVLPNLQHYTMTDTVTLPFGNGRSYGYSCISAGKEVLVIRRLNHFLDFNPQTGLLRCEAGVLLNEIVDLVLSYGWFLPVTPGTKFVTVGGAIANDVHGKNHHVAGTFGCHVPRFELVRSDGSRLVCSKTEHPDMYNATIGGLGLTGVITWAEIQLKSIKNAAIKMETLTYKTLSEFFAISADSDQDYEYTVAWVDCLAGGRQTGRGLFMRGNHAESGHKPVKAAGRTFRVPFEPPFSLVNGWSLKVFNLLYYNKQTVRSKERIVHYEPFFYPLDSILEWNRIYGPSGFQQYQCAIPDQDAEPAIREILERIAVSGMGSFLAVLKVFGSHESPGLMSFPLPGATLALDFPEKGSRSMKLFQDLDEVVRQANGRVYPAKDAHMNPINFKEFYPQWRKLEAFRDPVLCSAFWARVIGGKEI